MKTLFGTMLTLSSLVGSFAHAQFDTRRSNYNISASDCMNYVYVNMGATQGEASLLCQYRTDRDFLSCGADVYQDTNNPGYTFADTVRICSQRLYHNTDLYRAMFEGYKGPVYKVGERPECAAEIVSISNRYRLGVDFNSASAACRNNPQVRGSVIACVLEAKRMFGAERGTSLCTDFDSNPLTYRCTEYRARQNETIPQYVVIDANRHLDSCRQAARGGFLDLNGRDVRDSRRETPQPVPPQPVPSQPMPAKRLPPPPAPPVTHEPQRPTVTVKPTVKPTQQNDNYVPVIEKSIPATPAPKKAEARPTETKPVVTKPVDTKPVATKPVETKPTETKPVEVKPVPPTKPIEVKPPTPAKPATPIKQNNSGDDEPELPPSIRPEENAKKSGGKSKSATPTKSCQDTNSCDNGVIVDLPNL